MIKYISKLKKRAESKQTKRVARLEGLPLAQTIVFFLFIFFFFLLFPTPSFAQTFSVTINPSILELIIKPGKSISQEFKIINNGDPVILTPQIIPIQPDPVSGKILLSQIPDGYTSPSWFKLEGSDYELDKPFFLSTSQTASLNLYINIPQDSDPKDYYYALLLKEEVSKEESSTGVFISAAVGSNMLLSVTRLDTLNKNAEITDFSAPIIADSFDPPQITLKLKNTGAAFFKPLGNISINGLFHQETFNLLPQNILTGSQKIVQTTKSLTDNSISPASLKLNGFFLGPYTINTDITIDGTSIELKKTIHLFAFPFKAICIILILCVIVIWIRNKRSVS